MTTEASRRRTTGTLQAPGSGTPAGRRRQPRPLRRGGPAGLTAGVVLCALFALSGWRSPAAAQVEELAARCGAGGISDPVCGPLALAAQAMQGGIGLGAAGGNAFPGSGSTLGRRYGATPRVALSGRLGFNRFSMPNGFGGTGNVFAASAHGQVTVGVLNGFSLAPTVGGFLSLDLLASVDAVFLPGSAGFQENALGWGYGARVGILRESFTLPGVTLSVVRRSMGEVVFGIEDLGQVRYDVTTTSWRAVVGKDLAGLGFTAGAGWDDYDSDGFIEGPGLNPGPPTPLDGLSSDRAVFFAGVTKTFLVLQVGAELGWARGFSVEGDLPTAFDPSSGSLFGGVSLRLTF